MRRLLVTGVLAFVALAGFVLVRAALFRPVPPASATADGRRVVVPAAAAERLAASLRLRTISTGDSSFDGNAFRDLHAYLQRSFPLVHANLERETVGEFSLLYRWAGSDASLKPVLLMGHMDVVPVEPGTEATWTRPPFAGAVADGFVWGRGAIDNKAAVLGLLEAVELLLAAGHRPGRTIYLAFGHDEETGGARGARQVAALLRQRGVRLEMVVDEGGIIGDSILPGIGPPTALVGIAEKGFLTVRLSAADSGGHSSLPPAATTIGRLGAAVATLESRPMEARLTQGSAAWQMFDRVAREFPFAQRLVFANLWLTEPIVLRSLRKTRSTNAMIRTTTALTMFQGGSKDNVLASRASATVNFRILPGDSIAGVLAHVRRAVGSRGIAIERAGSFFAEPSRVSRTDSRGYDVISRATLQVVPGAIVAPFLVVVVTDARYFSDIADDIYRFLPLRLTAGDLGRMHGTDERIAVRDYEDAIRIYHELLRAASAG